MADESIAMKELREVFEDLDSLLKNPEVGTELAARGVNISLAIVAAEALLAYVEGNKERAAEDFDTVAEEIASRHAASKAAREAELDSAGKGEAERDDKPSRAKKDLS